MEIFLSSKLFLMNKVDLTKAVKVNDRGKW